MGLLYLFFFCRAGCDISAKEDAIALVLLPQCQVLIQLWLEFVLLQGIRKTTNSAGGRVDKDVAVIIVCVFPKAETDGDAIY
jgi:hypothetical protein